MPSDEGKKVATKSAEVLEPNQLDLFSLREVLDVERQKIDSANKRTELGARAIDAQNAADERQYQYAKQALDAETQKTNNRHKIATRLIWAFSGFVVSVAALLLYMVFFGSVEQSENAKDILRIAFTAAGGGGILLIIFRAIKQLL